MNEIEKLEALKNVSAKKQTRDAAGCAHHVQPAVCAGRE